MTAWSMASGEMPRFLTSEIITPQSEQEEKPNDLAFPTIPKPQGHGQPSP